VIDFKTDEAEGSEQAYKAQVQVYIEAISRATGVPARGTLLLV